MKRDNINLRWLTGLDLLRFMMAVSILIFHFPHFDNIHFNTPRLEGLDKNTFDGISDPVLMMDLPLKNIFSIIYVHGDFAVRIFWMISGAIFFIFYLDVVQNQKLSFYKFLFLRFSRLYPLHLITLVAMAVLQYIYLQKFGDFFIYKNNSVIHFILNLFMISYWNPRFGYSFNGPFWSVSIEMFLYIIFYGLAFLKSLSSNKHLLFLTLLLFTFNYLEILTPFNEGLLYFFAGCLLISSIINAKKDLIIGAVLLFLIFVVLKYGLLEWEGISRIINSYISLAISFLGVLTFMFLFRKANVRIQKLFRNIGNMTYAIYMIHIPMQVIFILSFYERGVSFFMSSTFLFMYLLICCILGHFTFRYIERPAQNFLRGYKKMETGSTKADLFLNRIKN